MAQGRDHGDYWRRKWHWASGPWQLTPVAWIWKMRSESFPDFWHMDTVALPLHRRAVLAENVFCRCWWKWEEKKTSKSIEMGMRKLIQGRINCSINSSLGSRSGMLEQGWGRGRSIHVRWQCQSRCAERHQVGYHCDSPQAEERKDRFKPHTETFAEQLLSR